MKGKQMNKPILCLDFDGVIHSYSSGWRGARNIPDPPVEGALEFIVKSLDHFTVAIFSSRSHQWGGRRAMKKWLFTYLEFYGVEADPVPKWWSDHIAFVSAMDPWNVSVRDAARGVIKAVRWPLFKPPALMSIDDRALTFNGDWSDPAYSPAGIRQFKPWNKRPDKIVMPARYQLESLTIKRVSP
jgi:hypothetical protein